MKTTPWYREGYRYSHPTELAAVYQRHGHGLGIRLKRTRLLYKRGRAVNPTITEELTITLTADDTKQLLEQINKALEREEATRQPCLTCKGPNVDWPLFLVCLDCRTTPAPDATP